MPDKGPFDLRLLVIMVISVPAGQVINKYLSGDPINLEHVGLSALVALLVFGLFALYRRLARHWGFQNKLSLACVLGVALLTCYKLLFGSPVPWLNLVGVGVALGLTPAALVFWAGYKEKDETSSTNDA